MKLHRRLNPIIFKKTYRNFSSGTSGNTSSLFLLNMQSSTKHMRKYFLLGCFASMQILSIACKKAASPNNSINIPASSTVSLLFGSWELRNTSGTLGNCQNGDYAAGNGNMWKFSDAGYLQYEEGQIINSGSYKLITDNCAATGRYMQAIVFPQSDYLKLYCDISSDSLIMYRGSTMNDMSIAKFVRMTK